ncbi:ABC transporter ATP-binding protein [Vagococcus zengguangii]|uniref:ABC transporter ATP-binding protein n=1 Tax=Vagococcus zengguangii TaxID=2571750 RepID=A0A4D7CWF4_9ENTE|nr:ABC transporter ATP-binding protein [Vagococcus zengguangii]QCI86647.1 ABC transporter ATP-binding protein [Vagococcus zengguangii]TLG79720.1 ABC transporter ATP-binding protein [Vagococcus zengguangii]
MLKTFWNYIKKHPLAYGIATCFALVSSGLTLVPNLMIQKFIDAIVVNNLSRDNLWLYLSIFFISVICIYVVDVIWVVTLFSQSYQYQSELRNKVYKKLLHLRTPFYERFRSGDLMTRMTSDIDYLGDTIGYGFMLIVSNVTWTVSILTIMIVTTSWQATAVSILPLVLFGYIVFKLWSKIDVLYENNRDSVAKLSNEVLEMVDGVRVMRAYGKKELEQARFQERTSQVLKKANNLVVYNGSIGQVAKLLTGLSMGIGLTYSGYLVSQGVMTLGQLIAFQIYLGMLSGAVWGLSDIVLVYQQGNVSFRKIDELLTAEDSLEKNGQATIESIEHIEFTDYAFNYPTSDETTLKKIDFSLKRGETLGIVGKTGSGKTTLVRQLLRQYPVGASGEININGRPIQAYSVKNMEGLIGYVPQEHILFSKTVGHNIRFGNNSATDLEMNAAIASADFSIDLVRMADGLETLIGEKGVSISGGQKQRVSIARALIRQPELLVLDDSLSAVDAKTERAIINNIREIRQDKTNVIVTHRLSAVAEADKVLVLEDGEIIEAGTPSELLANKGWYYEQYMTQQMEVKESENI